jgi:hypothetical protein
VGRKRGERAKGEKEGEGGEREERKGTNIESFNLIQYVPVSLCIQICKQSHI